MKEVFMGLLEGSQLDEMVGKLMRHIYGLK